MIAMRCRPGFSALKDSWYTYIWSTELTSGAKGIILLAQMARKKLFRVLCCALRRDSLVFSHATPGEHPGNCYLLGHSAGPFLLKIAKLPRTCCWAFSSSAVKENKTKFSPRYSQPLFKHVFILSLMVFDWERLQFRRSYLMLWMLFGSTLLHSIKNSLLKKQSSCKLLTNLNKDGITPIASGP